MTTSGSVNFSMTRNEIITDALEQISVLGEGETPSGDQFTKANRALNRLIKSFENSARHVWKLSEATLFPVVGQASYTLGAGSTDHCTESYVATTLSGAEAAGQTQLSVTSSTGMTAADKVGIVLTSGITHWTTITTVNSSVLITVTAALPTAAASGNAVYAYTTDINKPLDIVSIRSRIMSTAIDTVLDPLSYEDYMALPDKSLSTANITSWMFHRLNTTSKLYVWGVTSDSSTTLRISYYKPIEDFDSSTDTPDFPPEWYDYLVMALAVRLAPGYGTLATDEYISLQQEANAALQVALANDNRKGAIKFYPDRQNYVY